LIQFGRYENDASFMVRFDLLRRKRGAERTVTVTLPRVGLDNPPVNGVRAYRGLQVL